MDTNKHTYMYGYKELLGSSNEKAVLYLAEKHILGP